jgi:hypothetical protein
MRIKVMKGERYRLSLAAICLTGPLITQAEDNPLAKYLDAPGAKTTLPVNSAKSPFSLGFVQDAQQRFENFISPYGEDKMPGYLRGAAKYLAGE